MQENIAISRQIKAARILLDWSQEDLAHAANLSIATIRKLETGSLARHTTMQFVRHALEENGLEFIEPGGVRHRPEGIVIYKAQEEISIFFDEMYQASKKNGGTIIAVCASEDATLPPSDLEAMMHVERMMAIRSKISVQCILTDNAGKLRGNRYSEYRWLPPKANPVPFIVYGDRCALIVYGTGEAQKLIAIQSKTVSHAFRLHFRTLWEQAGPL